VLENTAGILTDRNISALAADASGHLRVGYFDRGIDLLTADNTRTHRPRIPHLPM
jgi:hypothetical protein